MTIALWIAVVVGAWLALGYLGGRYVYQKRRKYNDPINEIGPIGAGIWLMIAGPFGALIAGCQYIIDREHVSHEDFSFWDKFFNAKVKKTRIGKDYR